MLGNKKIVLEIWKDFWIFDIVLNPMNVLLGIDTFLSNALRPLPHVVYRPRIKEVYF